MMKKTTIGAMTGLMLGLCGMSYANPTPHEGLTLKANIGLASPHGDFKAPTNDIVNESVTNGNASYGLAMGYDFAINPMVTIGPEVGLQYAPDFSKIESTTSNDSEKQTNLSIPLMVAVKFYIPDVEGLSLFAKGGLAYNHWKIDGDVSLHDVNWNGVLGGGIGYDINQFNIFAQYTYNWLKVDKQEQNLSAEGSGGIGTLAIGVGYRFPM